MGQCDGGGEQGAGRGGIESESGRDDEAVLVGVPFAEDGAVERVVGQGGGEREGDGAGTFGGVAVFCKHRGQVLPDLGAGHAEAVGGNAEMAELLFRLPDGGFHERQQLREAEAEDAAVGAKPKVEDLALFGILGALEGVDENVGEFGGQGDAAIGVFGGVGFEHIGVGGEGEQGADVFGAGRKVRIAVDLLQEHRKRGDDAFAAFRLYQFLRYHEVLHPPLLLFDIDGTLVRRAGPLHRQVLEEAGAAVTGLAVTTANIPTQGMLDGQILTLMLREAEMAQDLYVARCPDLRKRVCPGARSVLHRLARKRVRTGLVTGNLSRIGWKKMECAGLRHYLHFGAFAEQGDERRKLVGQALREARRAGWITRHSMVALVGDHENDILAAQANGIPVVSVATGVSSSADLAKLNPDYLIEDLRSFPWQELSL